MSRYFRDFVPPDLMTMKDIAYSQGGTEPRQAMTGATVKRVTVQPLPQMIDKGAPVITSDYMTVPWMDQETMGVKNRLLVYGAGALAVLAVGFVAMRKKSSVAGYRRRSRR